MRNSRAIDPWSYATRIATPFWLGPLLHGDMMFQTWPKMSKIAENGRNGPHSQSHMSMDTASNNLTEIAIDTWDLGPNICPMSTYAS